MTTLTLDHIRKALTLPEFDVVAAWQQMAPMARRLKKPATPTTVRPAGVLVLLYEHQAELTFVLTQRTETVATHKGQISLPGGAHEPVDDDTRDTAIRETCEEVGVCTQIEIIGDLTPLYVGVSDFEINPHVGYISHRPTFTPDPVEVARVIEAPLTMLLDDTIKQREPWDLQGREVEVPYYGYDDLTIWGATAIMLSELEGRLREVV